MTELLRVFNGLLTHFERVQWFRLKPKKSHHKILGVLIFKWTKRISIHIHQDKNEEVGTNQLMSFRLNMLYKSMLGGPDSNLNYFCLKSSFFLTNLALMYFFQVKKFWELTITISNLRPGPGKQDPTNENDYGYHRGSETNNVRF